MGKRGTKRKTIWRALPLGEDDAGSGNEEEMLEEDRSTTSSVVGHSNNIKVHPPMFRVGDKMCRTQRRFPYDRFRSKEPLIKLESKTFDEEEYTKITTPRQDVLFKKGYFRRKRESSADESAPGTGEVEGEEPAMDQYIITNGFLDERGHYYVNGSSYEVYDPYSNTVIFVVGPPPYTNGVTQPVLAAVSCQPVPLQPVECYPPGSEWTSQGSPWSPSFPPPALHPDGPATGSVHNSDAGASFDAPETRTRAPYHHRPACVVPSYVYAGENSVYVPASGSKAPNEGGQAPRSVANGDVDVEMKTPGRRESEQVPLEAEERPREESEVKVILEKERKQGEKAAAATTTTMLDADTSEESVGEGRSPNSRSPGVQESTPVRPKEAAAATNGVSVEPPPEASPEARRVEKQSNGTQTTVSVESPCRASPRKPSPVRVKQSHSTQTMPEEEEEEDEVVVARVERADGGDASRKTSLPATPPGGVSPPSAAAKSEQGIKPSAAAPRSPGRTTRDEDAKSPGRALQEEPKKKLHRRRPNEERKQKPRAKQEPSEQVEANAPRTSYAKKVLDGLEQTPKREGGRGAEPSVNGLAPAPVDAANAPRRPATNVPGRAERSDSRGPDSPNKTTCRGGKSWGGDKFAVAETKRNGGKYANGSIRNGYERQRFGTSAARTAGRAGSRGDHVTGNDSVPAGKRDGLEGSCDAVRAGTRNADKASPPELSEKSSSASELSSPTELSSGQNTPPEKLIIRKMEQKVANDLSKTFGGESKDEDNSKGPRVSERRIEEDKAQTGERGEDEDGVGGGGGGGGGGGKAAGEAKERGGAKNKSRERKKKKSAATRTEEEEEGEQEEEEEEEEEDHHHHHPKPATTSTKQRGSKAKRKRKVLAEETGSKRSGGGEGDPAEDISPLLRMDPESQDFLLKAWDVIGSEADVESVLADGDDEILESLGLDAKWQFPKLPLTSDFLLFPGMGRERPKLSLKDLFVPVVGKESRNDLFTKTNIANMRSTRPEEFFASIVENPSKQLPRTEKKEGGGGGGRAAKKAPKGGAASQQGESAASHGGNKSKSNSSSKGRTAATNANAAEAEAKTATEEKPTAEKEDSSETRLAAEDGERKGLGIVDAVKTWLQESEADATAAAAAAAEEEEKKEEKEEKNGKEEEGEGERKAPEHNSPEEEEGSEERPPKNEGGNPMHAPSPEACEGCTRPDAPVADACIRVASASKDDGHLASGTEAAKAGKRLSGRLYRSSSWDAKLSELQIKKHFKFLTEMTSWDRRKLKDARLKKHFKFIAESASYCHDLIRDVRNGYEFATEELCDPKQSVRKYYMLSPSALDSADRADEADDGEVFDALEYKFLGDDGGRALDAHGNPSVTDSGVHSDSSESASEEAVPEAVAAAAAAAALAPHAREVCCKMQ